MEEKRYVFSLTESSRSGEKKSNLKQKREIRAKLHFGDVDGAKGY